LDLDRIIFSHRKSGKRALTGHPVPYQRVTDDFATTTDDCATVNQVRVFFTADLKTKFAAFILPDAKGFHSASGKVAQWLMFNPDGVLTLGKTSGQHNFSRR
jgi:hypothetical protein